MSGEKQFLALRKTNLVFLIIFVFLLGTVTYYALNWRAKEVSPAYIGPVSAPSVTQSPAVDWKVVEGIFSPFVIRFPGRRGKRLQGEFFCTGRLTKKRFFWESKSQPILMLTMSRKN